MYQDKLSLLIVNPNIGSRSILREVLKSFLYKASINYAHNLKEAAALISDGKTFDIGFVAYDLGQPEIRGFLSNLKNAEPEGPAAPPFIATLKSMGKDATSNITNLYLDGISGFISEPYSADDILALIKTIMDNKKKTEQPKKVKRAVSLILNEARVQLEQLSSLRLKGDSSGGYPLRALKGLSRSLEELYTQNPPEYEAGILEAFEKVQAPKNDSGLRKNKAAVRVRPHPGVVVNEIMTRKNITMESLQRTLRIDPEQFELFLQGQAAVDEHMSRELSRVFGKTSKEWQLMQKEYDVYLEKIKTVSAP